jgi:hypothetical protein
LTEATVISRKSCFVTIFLTFVVCFLTCGWTAIYCLRNRLVVENRSGQTISSLEISIGGSSIHFDEIAAGADAGAPFWFESDDHFVIKGRMADGKAIDRHLGYVTNGLPPQRARFTIRPTGEVDFEQWTFLLD